MLDDSGSSDTRSCLLSATRTASRILREWVSNLARMGTSSTSTISSFNILNCTNRGRCKPAESAADEVPPPLPCRCWCFVLRKLASVPRFDEPGFGTLFLLCGLCALDVGEDVRWCGKDSGCFFCLRALERARFFAFVLARAPPPTTPPPSAPRLSSNLRAQASACATASARTEGKRGRGKQTKCEHQSRRLAAVSRAWSSTYRFGLVGSSDHTRDTRMTPTSGTHAEALPCPRTALAPARG